MDLTAWTTRITQSQSGYTPHNPSSDYYYYTQTESNPNPNPIYIHPAPDAYNYYPQAQHQQQPTTQQVEPQYYSQSQTQSHFATSDTAVATPSSYYQDPYWLYYQQNTAQGSIPNQAAVTVTSTWAEQNVAGIPNTTTTFASQTVPSHHLGSGKWRRLPKKPIVQSAYCETCKVECSSKDVLEQHKLGKKHKKNLLKIATLSTSVHATSEGATSCPFIGPTENPDKFKADAGCKSKRTAPSRENLESKRMKLVACGAAAAAVKVCTACNVVCNSETVFQYHTTGQKHAASVKKYLALTAGNKVT